MVASIWLVSMCRLLVPQLLDSGMMSPGSQGLSCQSQATKYQRSTALDLTALVWTLATCLAPLTAVGGRGECNSTQQLLQ